MSNHNEYQVGYNFPFIITLTTKLWYETEIAALITRYDRMIEYWQNKLDNTQKKNRKELRKKLSKYKKLKINLKNKYPEDFI